MNITTEVSRTNSNSTSKTDIRIIKTKRAINNTLLELLQKKPIDKITIAELSQKAEISKGTFYLHYTDIYDLYQNALKEHFDVIVNKFDFMDQIFTCPEIFARKLVTKSIKSFIFENDPFFRKENSRYNQSAQFYFCQSLASKVFSYQQIPDTSENRMKLHFLFTGTGSLFRYDTQYDTDLMVDIIANTIKNLFLH